MERFQEARDNAIRHLRAADHMFYVTYPLIQDSKLLLGIVESIFLCVTNVMAAILWHDRLFKLVVPFHDTFEGKFLIFSESCVPRYKINKDIVGMIKEVKDVMSKHQKSPIEFRKKDRFIICEEDYSVITVTDFKIKDYLHKAKAFVALMNEIVSNDERIFTRS